MGLHLRRRLLRLLCGRELVYVRRERQLLVLLCERRHLRLFGHQRLQLFLPVLRRRDRHLRDAGTIITMVTRPAPAASAPATTGSISAMPTRSSPAIMRPTPPEPTWSTTTPTTWRAATTNGASPTTTAPTATMRASPGIRPTRTAATGTDYVSDVTSGYSGTSGYNYFYQYLRRRDRHLRDAVLLLLWLRGRHQRHRLRLRLGLSRQCLLGVLQLLRGRQHPNPHGVLLLLVFAEYG